MMMTLERAFLDDLGLPLKKDYKNIISAPSSLDSYSGSNFPGLYDLLWQYTKESNSTQKWEEVQQHFSAIVFHINCATQLLKQSLY